MASEATRDAKLTLSIETAGAERAIEKVGQKAEAAQKIMDRHGPEALAKPELSTAEIKQTKANDRFRAKFIEEQETLELQARMREAKAAQKAHALQNSVGRDAEFSERIAGRMGAQSAAGGGIGALTTTFSAAAAAAIAVAISFRSVAKTADDFRNSTITARGRYNSVGDTLSFGATGYIRGIIEDLQGTTAAIREFRFAIEDTTARFEANQAMAVAARANTSAEMAATFSAEAASGAIAQPAGRFDQSTARGAELQRQENLRVVARDEIAAAQRDAAAAQARHEREVGVLRDVTQQHQQSIGRREQTQAGMEYAGRQWTTSRESESAWANMLQQATRQEAQLRAQQEAQAAVVRDTGVSAIEAETRARQGNIQAMRTELEIARSREQLHGASASRWGSANPLERQEGLQALRMIGPNGENIWNVAPEVRAAAARVEGGQVSRFLQNFGERTPELQAARAEGLTEVGGTDTLAQMREQALQLSDSVRQTSLDSVAQLREGIRLIMQSFTQEILAAMRTGADNAAAGLQAGRALQAVGQK